MGDHLGILAVDCFCFFGNSLLKDNFPTSHPVVYCDGYILVRLINMMLLTSLVIQAQHDSTFCWVAFLRRALAKIKNCPGLRQDSGCTTTPMHLHTFFFYFFGSSTLFSCNHPFSSMYLTKEWQNRTNTLKIWPRSSPRDLIGARTRDSGMIRLMRYLCCSIRMRRSARGYRRGITSC